MNTIIKTSKDYAVKCHSETNHLYDGKPYSYHLNMVYDIAYKFIHLIPEHERHDVLASCWTHDVIEDCRQTYNDVKEATNLQVAELTYALTNDKGKNRKERAGDKYYEGIRKTPNAVFVKLCDRIANYKYSVDTGSRMADMYEKENESFLSQLGCNSNNGQFISLFDYARNIMKKEKI